MKKIAECVVQSSSDSADAIDTDAAKAGPDVYLVLAIMSTQQQGDQSATTKYLSINAYSLHKDSRDVQVVHSAQLYSDAAGLAYEQLHHMYGSGAINTDYPVISISCDLGDDGNPKTASMGATVLSADGVAGMKRRMSKAERKRAKKQKTTSVSVNENEDQDIEGAQEDPAHTQPPILQHSVDMDAISAICSTHLTILPSNHVECTILKRHTYTEGQRESMMICRVASPLQWCVAQDSYLHILSKMASKK
ncbi:hypothetical protein EON63_00680 [archaeon]|nr:MAG: hypothetical protein EON63_00680 [archaeon]